jgi:alpha-tubulin suppressor-like RCC1 family protein
MKAVAAGDGYTLAVEGNGRVWTWGRTSTHGPTGTILGQGSLEPAPVAGVSDVAQVAASSFALAVTYSGETWAWGVGDHGQLGQGNVASSPSPVRVPISEPVVAPAVSHFHAAALTASGKVYTWGDNEQKQLGDQSGAFNPIPAPVDGLDNVDLVSAGLGNTAALTGAGEVWAWGDNSRGQLGDETGIPSVRPRQIEGLPRSGIRSVDSGNSHMLALTASGEVYSWGGNNAGQLGLGSADRAAHAKPERIGQLGSGIVQAVANGDNSAAVTASGELWVWGSNYSGQLGNGASGVPLISATPIKVGGLPPVKSVAIGIAHTAVVTAAGELWIWGQNGSGQLGIGRGTSSVTSPVRVDTAESVTQVACGDHQTMAIGQSGQVWAWGSIHNLPPAASGLPASAPTPVGVTGVPAGGTVYGGDRFSLYASNSLVPMSWGNNGMGQLGNRDTAGSATPVIVAAPLASSMAAGNDHGVLVSSLDARVYTWGSNLRGQLGYSSLPWSPMVRVSDLDLGTFDLPTEDPTSPPTEDPTSPPTEDPTSPPTAGPTTDPSVPGDDPAHRPGGDPGPSHGPASTVGTDGAGNAGQDRQITAPTPGAPVPDQPGGNAPAPDPVPSSPQISRFAASFTTLVIRPKQTAAIPVVSYPASTAAGASRGPVRVAWTASAPRIAAVGGAKHKSGTWRWIPGAAKTIAIRGLKLGTTKIVLRSAGAKALVLRVRVVPPKEYRAIKTLAVRGARSGSVPRHMKAGSVMWLKARPHPVGAARTKATWRSTNPAVARIDRAGRLTAIGHGKTTIICRVRTISVRLPIRVT